MISHNLLEKNLFEIFRIYTGILLGPNDVLLLNAKIMSNISCGVVGSINFYFACVIFFNALGIFCEMDIQQN